jgi:DNA repair protein RadC
MCSKSVPELGPGVLRDVSQDGFPKHFHRVSRMTILSPASVARLIRSRISKDQEELWVVALSAPKRIVGIEMIFRGTVDSCMVHPRDIVRFLCESNATSYILAHNHPSGELEPSDQDWAFTRRLIACGELMEIPLLDHVIVTLKSHTSMATVAPALFKKSEVNDPCPERPKNMIPEFGNFQNQPTNRSIRP